MNLKTCRVYNNGYINYSINISGPYYIDQYNKYKTYVSPFDKYIEVHNTGKKHIINTILEYYKYVNDFIIFSNNLKYDDKVIDEMHFCAEFTSKFDNKLILAGGCFSSWASNKKARDFDFYTDHETLKILKDTYNLDIEYKDYQGNLWEVYTISDKGGLYQKIQIIIKDDFNTKKPHEDFDLELCKLSVTLDNIYDTGIEYLATANFKASKEVKSNRIDRIIDKYCIKPVFNNGNEARRTLNHTLNFYQELLKSKNYGK